MKQKRQEEPILEIKDTGVFQREKQQAAAWDQLTEPRQHLYGAATWQMLAAADLQMGDQVLDIAAGTGDQSRAEVRQAVRQFEGPQGIVAPAEVLLGVAMKERL